MRRCTASSSDLRRRGALLGVVIGLAAASCAISGGPESDTGESFPFAGPEGVTRLFAALEKDPGLRPPEVPAGTQYVRVFARVYSDGRPASDPVVVAEPGGINRLLEARESTSKREEHRYPYWLIVFEGKDEVRYWARASNTLEVLAEFVGDPATGRLTSERAEPTEGVVSVLVPNYPGTEARLFSMKQPPMMKAEPILVVPLGLEPPAPPGREAPLP